MSDKHAYTIYQPDGEPPHAGDLLECRVLGIIQTPYKRMADCPNRHNKRDFLPCTIRLDPQYGPGLVGLEPGNRVLVLYWLHLARRDMVQLPAREGVRDKPIGVFSLRTPPRPNPIAAAVAEVIAIRDNELDVVGLDCLDGTPLLDLKRARFYEGSETAGGLS